MTIGITALKAAIGNLTLAAALVTDELKNTDLTDEVRAEANQLLKDNPELELVMERLTDALGSKPQPGTTQPIMRDLTKEQEQPAAGDSTANEPESTDQAQPAAEITS